MFIKCVNTAKPEIIPAPVTPTAQTYSADSTVLVGKVSRASALDPMAANVLNIILMSKILQLSFLVFTFSILGLFTLILSFD